MGSDSPGLRCTSSRPQLPPFALNLLDSPCVSGGDLFFRKNCQLNLENKAINFGFC